MLTCSVTRFRSLLLLGLSACVVCVVPCMVSASSGDGEACVVVCVVYEYAMGCICGSGIMSSVYDVLEMSLVRGVRVVGRVCKICMCLGWVEMLGEWVRGLLFRLYQSCGNMGSVRCVSLFGLRWCGMYWGGGVCVWQGGLVLCLFAVRMDYACRWQVQISVYCDRRTLRILSAPSVQSCCTLSIHASYRILVCVRYHKSILVCVL